MNAFLHDYIAAHFRKKSYKMLRPNLIILKVTNKETWITLKEQYFFSNLSPDM